MIRIQEHLNPQTQPTRDVDLSMSTDCAAPVIDVLPVLLASAATAPGVIP